MKKVKQWINRHFEIDRCIGHIDIGCHIYVQPLPKSIILYIGLGVWYVYVTIGKSLLDD